MCVSRWGALAAEAGALLGSRWEAEVLAAHVRQQDRTWVIVHEEEMPNAAEAEAYRELVSRRRSGEPLPYIVGKVEFFDRTLRVDKRVLIPRPETEHVVERFLELEPFLPNGPVADVGTGSGCIAAVVGANCGRCLVAADTSADALNVARANTEALLVRADLLSCLRPMSLAAVLSNPPYVCDGDPRLDPAVAKHEPGEALFAGPDGLFVIRRLITQARRTLVRGGALVMEIGIGQAEEVADLLIGWSNVRFADDLAGIPRVVSAIR